ncbi:MAG: hypothetical protein K9G70_10850 [Prolixibacteraceae bacterium]|nr:hypothetical protein [Prolixibacteraceae bacterium]
MKHIFISLVFLALATACGQVYFNEPNPQRGVRVKSFSDELKGVYSDSTFQIKIDEDSINVMGDPYKITKKNAADDEVTIRYYKNSYFVSFKDSVYYSVFMARFYDDKLAVYMLNPDERSVEVLSRFVHVDTLDAKKEHYLISPSKKEFDALIDNQVFDVLGVFEKQ